MKKYVEYKDSGIEWIGEIPKDWEITTINRLFLIKAGGDVNTLAYSEEQTDIYKYPIYTNSVKEITPYGYTNVANYKANTITVTGRGDVGFAVYRNHEYDAIIRLLVLTPKKSFYCKYYEYFINAIIDFNVGSSAIGQLSTQQVAPYRVCCPSFEEQTKISDYLDTKTAAIDALIADKQKLIELLKEKRQAIISEAVTKGLDKNAKMKDSGIEWIGVIPEDWEVKRLKYLSNEPLMYGANESAEYDNIDYPRYIRITDIDDSGNLKPETFKSLPPEKAEQYIVSKGDILFARSGASVGKTYMHKSGLKACFAGYLIKLSTNETIADSKFIYYNTFTDRYSNWIRLNTIQATIQNVSAEKYNSYEISLPSIEIQKSIILYLDVATTKIDNLVTDITTQIEKLKEYRQSIISEAVTGKVMI